MFSDNAQAISLYYCQVNNFLQKKGTLMKKFKLSSELWESMALLLPQTKPSPLGGRPRLSPKSVYEAIIFIKANKLPWRAASERHSASKTALNDYYRHWAQTGFFHALRSSGLLESHTLAGVNLDWDNIDKLYRNSK